MRKITFYLGEFLEKLIVFPEKNNSQIVCFHVRDFSHFSRDKPIRTKEAPVETFAFAWAKGNVFPSLYLHINNTFFLCRFHSFCPTLSVNLSYKISPGKIWAQRGVRRIESEKEDSHSAPRCRFKPSVWSCLFGCTSLQ